MIKTEFQEAVQEAVQEVIIDTMQQLQLTNIHWPIDLLVAHQFSEEQRQMFINGEVYIYVDNTSPYVKLKKMGEAHAVQEKEETKAVVEETA